MQFESEQTYCCVHEGDYECVHNVCVICLHVYSAHMRSVCLVIYGESHGMAPRFSWGSGVLFTGEAGGQRGNAGQQSGLSTTLHSLLSRILDAHRTWGSSWEPRGPSTSETWVDSGVKAGIGPQQVRLYVWCVFYDLPWPVYAWRLAIAVLSVLLQFFFLFRLQDLITLLTFIPLRQEVFCCPHDTISRSPFCLRWAVNVYLSIKFVTEASSYAFKILCFNFYRNRRGVLPPEEQDWF